MMKTLAGAALALAFAASAGAQGVNTTLHANVDPYTTYNDVWGYRDPATGREIALLGVSNGTAIIETTTPNAPSGLGFFSHASSTWSDIRTYQNYAYVVNESSGGLQILDLSDLDNISLVNTITSFFQTSHNVCIDEDIGLLLAPGAGGGMDLLDLTADPVNPTQIATYTYRYVHDCYAGNGIALLAELGSNMRLMDTTNLPSFQDTASVPTPGNFTHNVWANRDNTIAITTDEVTGGHLAVFDISNKRNPMKIADYVENPSAIIHNTFMDGYVSHSSWYTEGYVAVDLSDPTKPQRLASYDTYPGPSGGFNGAWGCYPFQPSGTIYVSDTSTGLYILSVDCMPAQPYGDGYPGSGGITPTLRGAGGLPKIGNASYQFLAENVLGGAGGWFFIGFGKGSIPAKGATILIDLNLPYFTFFRAANGAAGVAGAGTATFNAPIPNDPAAIGVEVDVQYLSADPGASGGLAATAGLTFNICN